MIPQDLVENESLVKGEDEARLFNDYVGSGASDIQAEIFNDTFIKKELSECRKIYNVEYNTKAGTLLLIARRDSLRVAFLAFFLWMGPILLMISSRRPLNIPSDSIQRKTQPIYMLETGIIQGGLSNTRRRTSGVV